MKRRDLYKEHGGFAACGHGRCRNTTTTRLRTLNEVENYTVMELVHNA